MKRTILVLCVLLSGCASRPVWLENRLACAKGQAYVVSLWGPVGIASPVEGAACR